MTLCSPLLTHWGRVTHICVSKQTIIGSDNGLSPGRRQAIILTNAWILLIGPLGTKFNEISIKIRTYSFKEIHLKMSSGKWRPFCLGLNVLTPRSACWEYIWNSLQHYWSLMIPHSYLIKHKAHNSNWSKLTCTWLYVLRSSRCYIENKAIIRL